MIQYVTIYLGTAEIQPSSIGLTNVYCPFINWSHKAVSDQLICSLTQCRDNLRLEEGASKPYWEVFAKAYLVKGNIYGSCKEALDAWNLSRTSSEEECLDVDPEGVPVDLKVMRREFLKLKERYHILLKMAGKAPMKCCLEGCDGPAAFTIVGENETRYDVAETYACAKHIGDLLGSVEPTEPTGPWRIFTLRRD